MEFKESNLLFLVYSRGSENSEWILTDWEIDPYLLKWLGPDIAIKPSKSDSTFGTDPIQVHTHVIRERLKQLSEKNGKGLPMQIQTISGSIGHLHCTIEFKFERTKNKRPVHKSESGQPR